MELQWLIKIADQLVAENPDTTIKDYLDLIAELKDIENKMQTKIPNSYEYRRAAEKI